MYSAVLIKEQFLELRRELKQTVLSETATGGKKHSISGQMTLEMTIDMTDESESERTDSEAAVPAGLNHLTHIQKKSGRKGGRSTLVRQGYADKMIYQLEKCNQEMLAMKRECEQCCIVQEIDSFVQPLMRLQAVMDDYLAEQEEEQPAVRELLLDFYFEISHFLEIYELLDENYVKYTQLCDDGSFLLKLFCMNPAENLRQCMERGRSSILFSATFLPIQYYKKLLGGDAEDYEVYAQSVFNPEKRALFIAGDVTSKYTRRSEEEYFNIARYIEEIVKNRHGNYMVFCPSYAFLQTVYEKYVENFGGEGRECIIQSEYMREADRESFLARFQRSGKVDLKAETVMRASVSMEIEEEDSILIGFCVLGGIFSEGIDLKNDDLIGAIIVGTGLPQVCFEREMLKDFFNEDGEDGFDYSYRYPGMNKVLQAAGRVIRTVEDVGIVALLDERFLQFSYKRMFPREWEHFSTVTVETVAKQVERFWNEWL
ncbi:MAG: ATP-dependent DNA helicase [Acetatifactor sp.]|nr:ATP-dependent DNA helicase [Acetatifactor sp.]